VHHAPGPAAPAEHHSVGVTLDLVQHLGIAGHGRRVPPGADPDKAPVITAPPLRHVATRRICGVTGTDVVAGQRGVPERLRTAGIRWGRCPRTSFVPFSSPQQQHWLIQPLLDAGLQLDQIRTLVFRLAFEGIVTEGRGTLAAVRELVADQPRSVQAAWAQTIGRMILLDLP
jgi:hypothetical protein